MESRPAKNMCILSSESVICSYPWFFVCSWYNRGDAFDPTMSGVTLRIVWSECAYWGHSKLTFMNNILFVHLAEADTSHSSDAKTENTYLQDNH